NGPVYQSGTLSGNPLAMAAGIATLEVLKQPGFYEELEKKSVYLSQGLAEAAIRSGFSTQIIEISGSDNQSNIKRINSPKDNGDSVCLTRIGSMLCTFFTHRLVTDYQSASTANTDQYSRYFWAMLQEGVYLAPAQFEASFVSSAHTYDDLDRIIEASERAFASARG
ncbi:MAG: aminotransferase class III-fold pyridoxal phosphate-dependent enzyme, partial [Syntrophomonadaceae bacterium]|nr:aminotransferase class III-fold pyridoxal phosphate-dependent enzyme [Syntrophomonadaceae bacterium]